MIVDKLNTNPIHLITLLLLKKEIQTPYINMKILDTGNTNPIQPCFPFKVGMRVRRGISQHTVSNSMLGNTAGKTVGKYSQEIL